MHKPGKHDQKVCINNLPESTTRTLPVCQYHNKLSVSCNTELMRNEANTTMHMSRNENMNKKYVLIIYQKAPHGHYVSIITNY